MKKPRKETYVFFVKKRVRAADIKDAVRRERKAPIVEVWSDEVEPSPLGFKTAA